MDKETFDKLTSAAQSRVINQQKRESAYTNQTPKPAAFETKQPQTQNVNLTPKSRSKELLGLLNLKNISLDSDRALILGVLLLLAHEEADEWLILSLIYVML